MPSNSTQEPADRAMYAPTCGWCDHQGLGNSRTWLDEPLQPTSAGTAGAGGLRARARRGSTSVESLDQDVVQAGNGAARSRQGASSRTRRLRERLL